MRPFENLKKKICEDYGIKYKHAADRDFSECKIIHTPDNRLLHYIHLIVYLCNLMTTNHGYIMDIRY